MSRRGERWLWAGALLAVLIALGFSLAADPPGGREAEPVVTERPPVPSAPAASPALTDYDVRRFREKGLADPARDILLDLMARPDLIPDDPVLGGTMFFVEGESLVLSDRWVLATYEDGHIRGRGLYEYEVSEDGAISWRRMDSYLD